MELILTNKFNKYQSNLQDYKEKIPLEVLNNVEQALINYVYLDNLTNVNRKTISETIKDSNGKVVVDLTSPHILSDMDYFRKPALTFKQKHKYTEAIPSNNKKSAWAIFWKEEAKKCLTVAINPNTGEWIPGDYYFYLNYSPIMRIIKDEKGEAVDRVFDFPDVYDGDYLYFHYLYRARHYSDEFNKGLHGAAIKCRGRGYSFKGGSQLAKRFVVGDSLHAQKKIRAFALASEKEYLIKDGILNKFSDIVTHCADYTGWFSSFIKATWNTMEWRSGYMTKDGFERGRKNEVLGVSMKDNSGKARGKRANLIIYEEFGKFPNLLDAYNTNRPSTEAGPIAFGQQVLFGCVCAGTKVWTKDGRYINIEDLKKSDGILGFDTEKEEVVAQNISWMQPPAKKECVEIQTYNRTLRCSIDHPILVRSKYSYKTDEVSSIRRDYYKKLDKWYEYPKYKRHTYYKKEWKEAGKIIDGDVILVAETIPIWGKETLFDPRLVGMLIGDGSYGMCLHYGKPEYKTPSFSNCDKELNEYIENNYPHTVSLKRLTKDGKLYKEISIRGLVSKLKEIGIAGQSKDKKRLPINYRSLTKEDTALLLAGLFDTDGYVHLPTKGSSTAPSITIVQSSKDILIQIKELLEKFGVCSTINKVEPRISENRKDKNPWYVLTVGKKQSIKNFYLNIPLLIGYKKENLKTLYERGLKKELRKNNIFKNVIEERVISRKNIGEQFIYNLTAEGSHTYLANNIITHNTGGEIGVSFAGAEELIYHPDGYRILGIPNVYDKNTDGTTNSIFFSSEVLNLEGAYDKNGNSDVIKALVHIFYNRWKIKYNSSEPMALPRYIAEHPISIAEAIMRIEGNSFPIGDLKERLDEIRMEGEKFFETIYVRELVSDGDGNIKDVITDKEPIRKYPTPKDSKEGAVELFERPKLGSDNKPMRNRYIAGIDPYDSDTGSSLGCIRLFDLYTDTYVAKYIGRPKFADDFYETCRRLLLLYDARALYENNKPGLFNYFLQKGCTYLLEGAPQWLKDQEIISKKSSYGNASKGVYANEVLNDTGRRLQKEWMISRAQQNYQEIDENGTIITEKININILKDVRYMEEAIAWNSQGNFDEISAGNMVMLLREEKKRFLDTYKKQTDPIKSIVNSDYFFKNYDQKHKTFSHNELNNITKRQIPRFQNEN